MLPIIPAAQELPSRPRHRLHAERKSKAAAPRDRLQTLRSPSPRPAKVPAQASPACAPPNTPVLDDAVMLKLEQSSTAQDLQQHMLQMAAARLKITACRKMLYDVLSAPTSLNKKTLHAIGDAAIALTRAKRHLRQNSAEPVSIDLDSQTDSDSDLDLMFDLEFDACSKSPSRGP